MVDIFKSVKLNFGVDPNLRFNYGTIVKDNSYLIYYTKDNKVLMCFLYVDEKERRKGVGTYLINELKKMNLPIYLQCRASNNIAIDFYTKQKFKEIKRIKNYYQNEDGIVFNYKEV